MKNRVDEAQQTFVTFSAFLIFIFPYISDPNPPQPHHESKPHTHNYISKIQTPQPHLKSELHGHKSDQKLEITFKIPYHRSWKKK